MITLYADANNQPIDYRRYVQLLVTPGYGHVATDAVAGQTITTFWRPSVDRMTFVTEQHPGGLDEFGDAVVDRYASRAEAVAGHAEWVAKVGA